MKHLIEYDLDVKMLKKIFKKFNFNILKHKTVKNSNSITFVHKKIDSYSKIDHYDLKDYFYGLF